MAPEELTSTAAGGAPQPTPPAQAGEPSRAQQRPYVLPLILNIAIDAGVPTACYWLSMTYISHSEVVGLIVASIFPALKSAYGLLRKRELDPVSILILLGLVFAIAGLLFGGGPKLLLIRESLFTGAFGLTCIVSVLFRGRPLMFFFGRYFAAGNDPARRAGYDQLWQYPRFRRIQRIVSLVWGLVFVGEFALRLVLIYTVSTATVLAVSPVILGSATVLTMLWTFAYATRSGKGPARL